MHIDMDDKVKLHIIFGTSAADWCVPKCFPEAAPIFTVKQTHDQQIILVTTSLLLSFLPPQWPYLTTECQESNPKDEEFSSVFHDKKFVEINMPETKLTL